PAVVFLKPKAPGERSWHFVGLVEPDGWRGSHVPCHLERSAAKNPHETVLMGAKSRDPEGASLTTITSRHSLKRWWADLPMWRNPRSLRVDSHAPSGLKDALANCLLPIALPY